MIPRLAPHQQLAVEQLLRMLDRYGGALLADDVGLGKSWVAAAVGLTLKERFRIELFVPRALVTQWRTLLKEFGLDAEIFTHDALHRRAAAAGEGEPRLLIVDEAHRFRNAGTNRYHALSLCSAGNLLLLVTATPLCNRLEDLHALTRLIARDDAFAGDGVLSMQQAFEEPVPDWLDIIRNALVLRRTSEVLSRELQFGMLRRVVIRYALEGEAGLSAQLEKLRFPLIAASRQVSRTLRQLMKHRLESSPAALLESLRRQKRFYHRAREAMASGQELSRRDYRRIFGDDVDEIFFQDLLFRELWSPPSQAGAHSMTRVDEELELLSQLETSLRQSVDGKAELLQSLLQQRAGEQILIFTSAVATAKALFSLLAVGRRPVADLSPNVQEEGSAIGRRPTEPVALLTARHRWIHRLRDLTMDQVLESFRRGDVRILVMTDLGAEGLNLQNAGAVVHYDLPWNPVRIDQRNGRIHRIGQGRAETEAIYFLPERRSDRFVMRAVAAKNRVRRRFLLNSSESPATPETSRGLLPPRMRKTDPPAMLFTRLEKERLLGADLMGLLPRRYRFGTELIMQQLAGEFLDETRCAYLEGLLRREADLTGADSPPASPLPA